MCVLTMRRWGKSKRLLYQKGHKVEWIVSIVCVTALIGLHDKVVYSDWHRQYNYRSCTDLALEVIYMPTLWLHIHVL